MQKERADSNVSAEVSEPEIEEIVVRVRCNWNIPDVITRLDHVVKRAVALIAGRDEIYFLEPILVAKDVDVTILDELPSLIAGHHVRCGVRQNQLYIFELSTGPPHAGGVRAFNHQAGNWNLGNRFDIFSDATSMFGEEASGAPDMVLTIPEKYARMGGRNSVVIVELEVSNRTISQMRADYLKYFDDPSLLSVVGMKFFGSGACPVWRAAAVQWSRGVDGAISVTAVRDFGVLPLSTSAARYFSQHLDAALPGIPPAAWAENRHNPLATDMNQDAARSWIADQDGGSTLYTTSTTPTITFSGVALAASLHNRPQGVVIQDLVLDLATVLFSAVRATPYNKKTL